MGKGLMKTQTQIFTEQHRTEVKLGITFSPISLSDSQSSISTSPFNATFLNSLKTAVGEDVDIPT